MMVTVGVVWSVRVALACGEDSVLSMLFLSSPSVSLIGAFTVPPVPRQSSS